MALFAGDKLGPYEVLGALADAEDSLRIELLGGFRITRNGQPAGALATARVQSLIAYLILHPGAALSRQQLASLFWADSEESQARTNLRQLLHHFRAALPESAAYLNVDHQTLSWHPDDRFSSDVKEFEQSAGRGVLRAAARLYRGG
jgi:DNA-binding SARP family transcriptional activator